MRCPRCGNSNINPAGVSAHGKKRWTCGVKVKRESKFKGGCGWHGTMPVGIEEEQNKGIPREHADALHKKLSGAKGTQRYVITSAQNATGVWKPFWKTLLRYCEHTDAQLIVVPFRYKNPTSMWTSKAQHDDWWSPDVAKYLLDKRVFLHRHLVLLADIKMQPTAMAPTRDFETMTSGDSAIVGHPKLELITVPTPQARMPKILTTTGACTEKNYIPSKAGKKAEHHHTYGACVVEIQDGLFHIRQINSKRNGSFCDLDYEYYPDRAREMQPVAGIVMGDTHVDFVEPDVVKATFGKGSLVRVLNPKVLVWHDILDFYSGTHHHRGKVFTNIAKHFSKRNNVEAEVDRCFSFVDTHGAGRRNIIVNSNHHNHMKRWVNETDPRNDPENAVFWAKTFTVMAEHSKMTPNGATTVDPFMHWAKIKLSSFPTAVFLGPDDSYQVEGIEVGYHGDVGANGSRGNIRGFGKIGTKSVIGHSHSPGIRDGVFQVGTSSRLRLEYNLGPSSWLHTHCVIYKNGKRALVNIIDGKWRAE